jgi:hypothetical protein
MRPGPDSGGHAAEMLALSNWHRACTMAEAHDHAEVTEVTRE